MTSHHNEDDKPPRSRRHNRWAGTAGAVGKAVLLALLLRAFVAEAHVIPSESMTPTLQVGDRIFADKFSFGLSVPFTEVKLVQGTRPRAGEVVIFTHPRDGKRLVKRVVATAGQIVAWRNSRLYVDGQAVPRHRLPRACAAVAGTAGARWLPDPCVAYEEQLGGSRHVVLIRPDAAEPPFGPYTVPAGHAFVMGDNRAMSSDSRVWGPVPYSHLKGQARLIWWSNNGPDGLRWGRLGRL